jgi:hypothetical protein
MKKLREHRKRVVARSVVGDDHLDTRVTQAGQRMYGLRWFSSLYAGFSRAIGGMIGMRCRLGARCRRNNVAGETKLDDLDEVLQKASKMTMKATAKAIFATMIW